jgi:putative ABC transport system permease protein
MSLLLLYSVRCLIRRKWVTLTALAGLAFATAVMLAISALIDGLNGALKSTGTADRLLVLRKGMQSELASMIDFPVVNALRSAVAGAGLDPEAAVVAERVVVVVLPRRDSLGEANVTIRGTALTGRRIRNEARLVEGRWFRAGAREAVVGRYVGERVDHASIGSKLDFGKSTWTVVGRFDAGGRAFDSEIWVDADQVASDFERSQYSSVLVQAAGPREAAALQERLGVDPRFRELDVLTEAAYYAQQTSVAVPIKVVGTLVAAFLFLGGVFALMNTMYAAVSFRVKDIAVLRALGFHRGHILLVFLVEAAVLAAVAALLAIVALAPLSGLVTGTQNAVTFSEIAFRLEITGKTLVTAAALAVSLSLLGGSLPALWASRSPFGRRWGS